MQDNDGGVRREWIGHGSDDCLGKGLGASIELLAEGATGDGLLG